MKGPINDRKNVAGAEKQLESMAYRLTQERGSWPFLTPRLENVTDKTKDTAPLLIRQICELLQDHFEHSEKRGVDGGSVHDLSKRDNHRWFLERAYKR